MVHDLINDCNDAKRQEKLEFQYILVSAETSGLEPGRASDLSHFMRAAKLNGTEKREPVYKNRNCVPERAAVGRHH